MANDSKDMNRPACDAAPQSQPVERANHGRDAHVTSRRGFLKTGAALAISGVAASVLGFTSRPRTLWQIDPDKCIQCGNCATCCVLGLSAVKCVHHYATCGYCERCFGYFDPATGETSTAAENQLCPMRAIERTFVEDPHYQYKINEPRCIGCGKCVKGCGTSGNGTLYLQVRHDRCVNCNQCSIALACPSGAFKRVPADNPYLIKTKWSE
jgi:electron transport complex protein RnfB